MAILGRAIADIIYPQSKKYVTHLKIQLYQINGCLKERLIIVKPNAGIESLVKVVCNSVVVMFNKKGLEVEHKY